MDRQTLLDRYESKSSRDNYQKAFNKFDNYLSKIGLSEATFLFEINRIKKAERYERLQGLIDYLKTTNISPRTIRDYFDRLFKYFILMGCDLDYTQKRIMLVFPRIIRKRFEGIDRRIIEKELLLSSENFGTYLKVLAGAGMRETEALLLTPSMIRFNEYPTRLELPAEITKFNIPRESFLPAMTSQALQNLITNKGVKDNQTIFVKEFQEKNSLIDFEKYFDRIRHKAGLETKDRKYNQQNDITLHSHRSFYITTFTDNGLMSFGHATAGHSKDLSIYYRKTLETRREIYAQVMNLLDF